MKKHINLLALSVLLLSMVFITCKKDKGSLGIFDAEEAKVEARSANQTIRLNLDELMAHSSMESLMYLMELLDMDMGDAEWVASFKKAVRNDQRPPFVAANSYLQSILNNSMSKVEPEDRGIYTFNFATDEFDITNSTVDYLMYIYPANEESYFYQQNNAELKNYDLETVEIEITDEYGTYTEVVISKMKMTHKIENQVVMTTTYSAGYSDSGMPTSISLNTTMSPFAITMTQSGSGVSYNYKMNIKKGSEVFLSQSQTFTYTPEKDALESVNGSFQIPPVDFQGSINMAAIENCGDDLNCINSNINMQVVHVSKQKIIGDLAMRFDDFDELDWVLIYSDGSWEWLYLVLGYEFEDWKDLTAK